jgi:lon-related putative ATP-dependent protease
MTTELAPEKLRRLCDPASLDFASTTELNTLETIIGQDRAVSSLQFGLGIQDPGFNIYVSGLPGTGRTTAVRAFLQEMARRRPVPGDWCYVHSFSDPYRPQALRLPPGQARHLRADMKSLVTIARRDVRAAFESEEYAAHRQEASQAFQRQREEVFGHLDDTARKQGFLLQATAMGLNIVPVRQDKPLSEEEFSALAEEERGTILKSRDQLQVQIEAAIRQGKRLEKSAAESLEELDQKVARYALGMLTGELKEKYAGMEQVLAYLDQVQEDMLQHLEQFKGDSEEQTSPATRAEAQEDIFRRYEVNVLVDNSGQTGAPVIIEANPTYSNVFGRIEQEMQFGVLVTDFTLVRGGALHRANGGYLVIPVEEMLRNPFTWDSLKRNLSSRKVTIEDMSERLGVASTKSLQPAPIPLDVRVVLIGQPEVYYLLREYDEYFSELFKVKAEFDTQMDRTDVSIRHYGAFASTVCGNEGLVHLDATALAKLVEHGSRLVEDQEKLSTHFRQVADIIREASYYAAQENAALVSARHITKAIDQSYYRSSLIQARIQEMIRRGTVLIDVAGGCVGQVNGLSVVSLGDASFGQPSRITASVSPGREGLVDIEREAKLGGPIHTKGVLILAGFLASRYAKDQPLSLSARLVFEQSYSGVEGDSASSTELYALLSGLSGLPIQQGIAVTGSVNQKGQVQAIGGVNEKIEGFYDVCKAKGLSGEQGVLIPEANVTNLMLKEEVVEAVGAGRFHVWSVSTIDEGIEILTGVPAGEELPDGTYPVGSVNYLVGRRLRDLAKALRPLDTSDHAGGPNEGGTHEA